MRCVQISISDDRMDCPSAPRSNPSAIEKVGVEKIITTLAAHVHLLGRLVGDAVCIPVAEQDSYQARLNVRGANGLERHRTQ